MRKLCQLLTSFLVLSFFLLPLHTHAYEHGYQRRTEEIYAMVRHDLAVYESEGDNTPEKYLPHFSGIRVINKGSLWCEIEYTSDNNYTNTGWITTGDFYSDCLIYDGSDKQRIANGDYQILYQGEYASRIHTSFHEYLDMNSSFDLTFTYIGKNLYLISKRSSDEYMKPDPLYTVDPTGFWGSKEEAGAFYVVRKGDYFSIQDSVSKRYLTINADGLVLFDKNAKDVCWKFTRFNKATQKDCLKVFAQFDAEWASHYYGPGTNDDPDTNVFCTSACGIFATMNAVYALTGMYADPYAIANFAVQKEFRILDNGTDNGLFKAFAAEYGDKYGFYYDGSSGSFDLLMEKLKNDEVAITHVPGHYVAIVSYDENTKRFLLLDPHYLPKRQTCAYGDWVDLETIESSDGLRVSEFFFYKAKRPAAKQSTEE